MVEPSGKKCVVMVVEDDEAISDLFGMTLEQEGYDVCVASDGQVGLDLINSRRPSAVLLDLMLPVIDGLTIIRRLLQDPETAKIPITVVSAYADAGDTKSILRSSPNVTKVFTKPVRVADLLAQVKIMVAEFSA